PPLPAAAHQQHLPGRRGRRLLAARRLPGHLRGADTVAGLHGRDVHLLKRRGRRGPAFRAAALLAALFAADAAPGDELAGRGAAEVEQASAGCVTCHTMQATSVEGAGCSSGPPDAPPMHAAGTVE